MSFHTFRGQRTARPNQATRGFSQATNRTSITSFDQFDREYVTPVEKNTGMPCGLPDPQFWSPWLPDYHLDYWIFNPDNPTELFLNLEKYVADRIRAMREYHQRAMKVCAKERWGTPKLGEYPQQMVDLEKPPRAYQLAIALMQGNPWVLGESQVPDPRLEQYLEQPSREINEAIGAYDFGRASYEKTSAGGAKRPDARNRFADAKARSAVAAQEPAVDPTDPEAVFARFGATDEGINPETAEEFDGLGDGSEESLDSLGTEPKEDDAQNEKLEDLDDELDPEAMGGRTIAPTQADRAARQAQRRPTQTAVAHKRGAQASRIGRAPGVTTEKRRTLADGAHPVVGDG